MTNDNCGWPTADDTACRNPATGEDGRCWIDSHGDTKMGRPSKFNDEREQRIIDAARNGTTIEGCARAAGIHKSTLYDWLDKYPDFSDDFNRARAQAERRLLEEVADRDPKFILERSYDYVKTERHEVGVDDDYDFEADGFEILLADERD